MGQDATWKGDAAAALPPEQQERLRRARASVRLLEGRMPAGPVTFRDPVPGDYGWVISRHAALYAAEYGWDGSFEALVAEIVAAHIRSYDPAREQGWIAEVDGTQVGSVFLVRATDELARLRLMFVQPEARGHGIGAQLVRRCIARGRELGYRRMTLWTHSVLVSARRIYAAAGFRMVEREPVRMFGADLMAETWEMEL